MSSRVFEQAQPGGGIRALILGAGFYPLAQQTQPKVPHLAAIDSAARSAIDFATQCLTEWKDLFLRPLASVDLLVNDEAHPDGVEFEFPDGTKQQLDAPTLPKVLAARTKWLADVTKDDTLIFYCCGHGIWIPSFGRTFLCSDFGEDPEAVWPKAVSLDAFTLGLGDKEPREQWLIFDCCATEAPNALRNSHPSTNPLIESTTGRKLALAQLHGPLVQTVIASSLGMAAFGRANGRSRFMDVFIEACSGPGFQAQDSSGRWQLNSQGLETAMASYCFRVANFTDIDYYTFPRLITSDATRSPALMLRDEPAQCTLLITSEPPIALKQCDLDIYRNGTRIDGQARGPSALERFKSVVDSYELYRVSAHWPREMPYASDSQERRALPPICEVKF